MRGHFVVDFVLVGLEQSFELLSFSGPQRLRFGYSRVEPLEAVVYLVTFEQRLLNEHQSHFLVLDGADVVQELLLVFRPLLCDRHDEFLHPLAQLSVVVVLVCLDVVLKALDSFLEVLHCLRNHLIHFVPRRRLSMLHHTTFLSGDLRLQTHDVRAAPPNVGLLPLYRRAKVLLRLLGVHFSRFLGLELCNRLA